jgi:putative tricarboxylic transport membrane protein
MHDQGNASDEPSLASNRVLEIVVALALLTVSGIIIYDSNRLGFGWVEGQGPAAGYFPFYISCVLGIASLAILLKAVLGNSDDLKESFVSRVAFGRVLTVLVPAIGYVAAIQFIGLYFASCSSGGSWCRCQRDRSRPFSAFEAAAPYLPRSGIKKWPPLRCEARAISVRE